MAFITADRVKETTTTTGTGTVTLAGAVSGFRTFSSVMATSDTCYYCIDDGAGNWEVGVGTLASSTTLARTTVLTSSNANALVSFAAGTKSIYLTVPAAGIGDLDPVGTLNLPSEGTTSPAAAPASSLGVFAKTLGGRIVPAVKGPAGLDVALQPHIGRSKVRRVTTVASGAAPVADGVGITPTGTGTVKALATTNLHTSMVGLDYLVTVAATTAVAGWRQGTADVWLGNAAGLGGFYFVCRFSPATGETGVTTARCFTGLANSGAAPTDVDPSTLTQFLGIGYARGTDTNWQFYNNAASTTTKTATSIAVPTADRPSVFELVMYAPPNATSVSWEFTDLGSGSKSTGTQSTNLPTNTNFLAGRGYHSVGGTSSVTGYTLFGYYLESDI